jgi:hypothetical protein
MENQASNTFLGDKPHSKHSSSGRTGCHVCKPQALHIELLRNERNSKQDECHQLGKKFGWLKKHTCHPSFLTLETINNIPLQMIKFSLGVALNEKSLISKLYLLECLLALGHLSTGLRNHCRCRRAFNIVGDWHGGV